MYLKCNYDIQIGIETMDRPKFHLARNTTHANETAIREISTAFAMQLEHLVKITHQDRVEFGETVRRYTGELVVLDQSQVTNILSMLKRMKMSSYMPEHHDLIDQIKRELIER